MPDRFDSAGRWVVGTDGSARADKAIMWAAKHASQRTVPVPLLILHVIPESPLPAAAAQDVINDDLGLKDAVRLEADKLVQGVADRVRESYPDLIVETAVVRGLEAQVLAAAGADADQIVVGGGSDHVVANAQGTGAVIPEQVQDHPGGPVVLGLDDSEQGRLAKARAFQAASLRGVPLIAIPACTSSRSPAATGPISEVSTASSPAAVRTHDGVQPGEPRHWRRSKFRNKMLTLTRFREVRTPVSAVQQGFCTAAV